MRKYVGWMAVGLVLVSVGVYGYLASPWQSARSSKASDTLYDSSFFEALSSGSASSAAQSSGSGPVDCAQKCRRPGVWHRRMVGELRKLGVTDVLGVDGDWVNPTALKIPTDQFRPFDLRNKFAIDRAFDLAISVETRNSCRRNVGRVLSPTLLPWLPSFYFQLRLPARAVGATSTNNGRITGLAFLRNTTMSLWTFAAKILERFTNRMVVPSEHHSLRPARSHRGRSETSVPGLIAAARCDSFPPETSVHGHSNAGDCCCGRRRSSSDRARSGPPAHHLRREADGTHPQSSNGSVTG